MIVTVCKRTHYAAALTLGKAVAAHHPDQRFVIGVADDASGLPTESANVLGLPDTGLSTDQLTALSARYSPTEFTAALKSSFIRAAFGLFPDETTVLYLAPTAFVYQPLSPVFTELIHHSILLNPHWLTPPTDGLDPDEKHMQNVGLYSGGFIGFRRHHETMRMLDWWAERSLDHAAINFCIGSCLDQLWLMHVPTLFENVGILKNPGLQVALWNLPQRPLTATPIGWQVGNVPVLTADFLGLTAKNEGLFQHQNRLRLNARPDIRQLLADYNAALIQLPALPPAYGQQPERMVRTGIRRKAGQWLTRLSDWIDNVPVPPVHR